MFGILRTTLALMVMVYHLFIGILPLGTYAVFGFYIISGYLMTLIMHESYGYSGPGRIAFAVNRVLRLYPQYWAASIFSVLLIFFLGSNTVLIFHESIFLPESAEEMLYNLLLMFPSWSPNSINPRLVPPAWAITVEIFFYILICIGISKTFRRVKIWFILSTVYVIASFLAGLPWSDRYFSMAASSLPFSIGSGIYFLSKYENLYQYLPRFALSSPHLFGLMLANCMLWTVLSRLDMGKLVEVGFYINLAIFSLLVYSLATGSRIFKINPDIDKRIGDFSYPVYLLHWQTGLLVSFLLFGESVRDFSANGLISLVVSTIFVSLLSLVFIYAIDTPVQRIRSRIRTGTRSAVIRPADESDSV